MNLLKIFFRRDTIGILLALMFATAVCFAISIAGVVHTGRLWYAFWIWNLFLAWLPLVFALVLREMHLRGESVRWKLLTAGGLWLLFFPNAPYVFTDLVHLVGLERPRFWMQLSLALLCGLTGLVLGFVSLQLMQTVVVQRWGRLKGWLFVAGISGLASLGICLGRFYRLNSWDALLSPVWLMQSLFAMVTDWFHQPRTLAVPAQYAIFIFTAYVMLYATAHLPKAQLASAVRLGDQKRGDHP